MASPGKRPAISAEGLASQTPDVDPEETAEWLESLDGLLDSNGQHRARYIMLKLLEHARDRRVGLPALRSSDYINTISTELEPEFPGDEHIERRIRAFIRWNAAVMVSKANRKGLEVGGHIATYQSAASLYEVGLNHFFRGKDHPGGGDHVYFQGHASPGIYARAYLEGRLSADQLDGFRQDASRGPDRSVTSYPHPRIMPQFWEYPTVDMGITGITSIYQARFNRYLHNRGIRDTSGQHVWAFLGDGEMGEPESLGAIGVAGREELDNLTWVVNCNLQQLDGPVRGNGKVVQELESMFLGAGWNVIKVLWARDWDPLLKSDVTGALVNKMNTTPDGQFQTYAVEDGSYIRQKFFDSPELQTMVGNYSDDDLRKLGRGGHDYRKVYAAFRAATEHVGQPTVILAQTVKGWTIDALEARNSTHQMKKLTTDDLKAFRDRLYLPINDDQLNDASDPPYYHPGDDSPEMQYMQERRKALGGYMPERRVKPRTIQLPGDEPYAPLLKGGGHSKVASTQALVRLLREWLKEPEIGERIVPIAPDEFRTFGMDSLFPTAKIYSPHEQTYDSVDRKLLLSWKEGPKGQLLHEGISELGSVGSFTAAGSSYATHGEPMIPIYIFYSMFGFQRTADFLWATADQLARGFLIGATAGRTTLTGEGTQHMDGQSPLLASTNPAVVHYDPAFGFELAHIMRDGLRRMYGYDNPDQPGGEDVMYYLTVYNEPVDQPEPPDDLDVQQLLKGLYRFKFAPEIDAKTHGSDDHPTAQILVSGITMTSALQAQQMLADEWGVAADVWSVTSWNELRRDALEVDQHNFNHPGETRQVPYVTETLTKSSGPVVAVSDFMRAVQDQIQQWVPNSWASLGADGFGIADTRAGARRYFQIDAPSIVVATLEALAHDGLYDPDAAGVAFKRYELNDPTATSGTYEEGGDA